MNIADNIKIINEKIMLAAEKSGRRFEDILLVGVTKTIDAERIRTAVECGVTTLGENRVQELAEKLPHVQNAAWHIIGHLQTNKVKYIAGKTDLIHSVDSIKLAEEIDKQSAAVKNVQSILIQVNISGEATKFGIAPNKLDALLENLSALENIKVKGLMTIAPSGAPEGEIRKLYENCNNLLIDIGRKKYHNICMELLSMGMSGDFETAIECGSNIVRVGAGIFGQRNYNVTVL